jgi:hypothetical protein
MIPLQLVHANAQAERLSRHYDSRERESDGRGKYVRKCQFKYFRKEVATFNLLAVIAMTTVG